MPRRNQSTSPADEACVAIATLIEDHSENGSPFIDSPKVLEAIEEILTDSGYIVVEEEDEDEDEDESEEQ